MNLSSIKLAANYNTYAMSSLQNHPKNCISTIKALGSKIFCVYDKTISAQNNISEEHMMDDL